MRRDDIYLLSIQENEILNMVTITHFWQSVVNVIKTPRRHDTEEHQGRE
jgi:hypothetical protein